MSYQIKSTPFFRRMLSNSRRNGELQRLKEEYEKMKDFNEHTIELKMRQLRLKRLFKEIEDLKEINLKKRRLNLDTPDTAVVDKSRDNRKKKPSRSNYKTQHRADVLDTSTSREGRFTPHYSGIQANRIALKSKPKDSDDLNRVRLIRRLDYGNQTSSRNLNRMVSNKVGKEMNMLVPHKSNSKRYDFFKRQQLSETAVAQNKKEMLKHRLDYGNSKSNGNLNKPLANKAKTPANSSSSVKAEIQHYTSSTTLTPSNANNPNLNTDHNNNNNNNNNRNYFSVLTAEEYAANKDTSEMFSCLSSKTSEDEKTCRARGLWQKVHMLSQPRGESAKAMEILEKCSSELDYQLRNISNDTDLSTLTNLDSSLQKGSLTFSEHNLLENETLTRIETYEPVPRNESLLTLHYNQEDEDFQPNYQQYQCYQQMQPLDLQHAIKQPHLQKTEQMDIITQFMPFIEDTVKKEASTFCVKKLRRIFEEKHAA